MIRPSHAAAVSLLAAALACQTRQEPPGDNAPVPPAPAKEPEGSPLSGPRVVARPRAISLVERDMSGALVRLETRPEAAALGKLDLDAASRAAADKVLADRAKVVSQTLWDNIDDVLALQGLRQSGDRRGSMAKIAQMRPALQPLLVPTLRERLSEALPAEKREQFAGLVAEYTSALAAEEAEGQPASGGAPAGEAQRGSGGAPPAGGPRAVPPERRIEMNLTLRELGRSLAQTVNERKERTEAIIRMVEATPEQEEKIRTLVRSMGEKTLAQKRREYLPSPEERAELMRQITAILTPEQRTKLMQGLRRGE